ncbi:unnamed protein product, partial [marine sediment metagenome]
VTPSKKYQGRFGRIFSLEDLGIVVPPLKAKGPYKEATTQDEPGI